MIGHWVRLESKLLPLIAPSKFHVRVWIVGDRATPNHASIIFLLLLPYVLLLIDLKPLTQPVIKFISPHTPPHPQLEPPKLSILDHIMNFPNIHSSIPKSNTYYFGCNHSLNFAPQLSRCLSFSPPISSFDWASLQIWYQLSPLTRERWHQLEVGVNEGCFTLDHRCNFIYKLEMSLGSKSISIYTNIDIYMKSTWVYSL